MTYLIQAPPYVFAYLATVVISWSSGRHMEHCWHIVGCTVACIVGTVIMISTLNVGARYFGMFLLCAGPFVGLNVRNSCQLLVSCMLIIPDPHTLGNHKSCSAPYKEGCTCRNYQLHCFSLALVLAILLRKLVRYTSTFAKLILSASFTRTPLPERWRLDHRRMRSRHSRLLGLSMVH